MKTILKVIAVLLVAGVVAGAFSLAVNSSLSASTTSANGQSFQQVERPEGGDHDGGSVTQGLAGVAGTLMKLTGISILVLLLQKGFRQPGKRKLISIQP